MPRTTRRNFALLAAVTTAIVLTGCGGKAPAPTSTAHTDVAAPLSTPVAIASPPADTSGSATSAPASGTPTTTDRPGQFTMSFAGDVHFADRTATLLAADPATAFGSTTAVLSKADLTMVNLETAIAVGGAAQNKSFTFQAPPTAFTALRDAGIDIATMANNHGADYGAAGLAQTLAAIKASRFPVVGIGANATAAFAPYYRTVNGVRLAVIAASQVQDETLANFSATDTSPGIANAFSDRLLAAVRTAKAHADVVVTYLHWGTEYQSCPNADQQTLANQLAAAGVTAIIGTHAHVLQGAGWRPDGTYVAYGLGNYYWWKSFGNDQDDNGVLTLTLAPHRVVSASFAPSHLTDTGISPPATGAQAARIRAEFETDRQCTDLAATPPN